MPDKPDLDAAYALETPDDNRALYADWAASYDAGFVRDMDYQLPQHVAGLFLTTGAGGPVLDVGAGTGLVGEVIAQTRELEVDALDISAEMLTVAASKGVYRTTIEGDLTERLPMPDASYAAVISSGTFTHGHVGPDALDELLRVARPEAQFVLSINAEHWEARGFADKFSALEPHIDAFEVVTVPIYGAGAPEDHRDDKGHIAVFRKA